MPRWDYVFERGREWERRRRVWIGQDSKVTTPYIREKEGGPSMEGNRASGYIKRTRYLDSIPLSSPARWTCAPPFPCVSCLLSTLYSVNKHTKDTKRTITASVENEMKKAILLSVTHNAFISLGVLPRIFHSSFMLGALLLLCHFKSEWRPSKVFVCFPNGPAAKL